MDELVLKTLTNPPFCFTYDQIVAMSVAEMQLYYAASQPNFCDGEPNPYRGKFKVISTRLPEPDPLPHIVESP